MKNKTVLVLAALVIAFLWFRSPSGGAPLADGAYLAYQQGETTVRLTFNLTDGDEYRTLVEVFDRGEAPEVYAEMMGQNELVDSRMRTDSRAPYELGAFGPLWVDPGQLEEGGNAHGSKIAEIRAWNGRDVAVVSATVGMGVAFRGEWYYDLVTGFLVGGMKSTGPAVGSNDGQRFALVDTNVVGLVVP
jgi:hypothetical protein